VIADLVLMAKVRIPSAPNPDGILTLDGILTFPAIAHSSLEELAKTIRMRIHKSLNPGLTKR
jgi:hypothetical protein